MSQPTGKMPSGKKALNKKAKDTPPSPASSFNPSASALPPAAAPSLKTRNSHTPAAMLIDGPDDRLFGGKTLGVDTDITMTIVVYRPTDTNPWKGFSVEFPFGATNEESGFGMSHKSKFTVSLHPFLLDANYLSIIDHADIICAVPSLAFTQPSIANWKNKVARGISVDEAASINRPDLYAVWGNTFLPCLLAGDEKQLAPVVNTLSDKDAEQNAVNRLGQDGRISPLEFIKGFGWPIYRLRTQLRMAVGQFDLCKATFYADVDSVYGKRSNVDLPEHAIGRQLESFIANQYPGEVTPAAPGTSQPLFVHCKFARCIKDEVTGSRRNADQIEIALTFLCDFLNATPTAKAADILIITPYAAMIDAIASARKRPQFAALRSMRPASTIYSIQGQEADMVAVITATTKAVGPGFTADDRQLNVMLSRHKSALVVFGDLHVAGPLEKTKPVAKGSKPPKVKEVATVRVRNPEGEVTFMRPKRLKKINQMLLDLGRVLTIESAWKKKGKGKAKANDPEEVEETEKNEEVEEIYE